MSEGKISPVAAYFNVLQVFVSLLGQNSVPKIHSAAEVLDIWDTWDTDVWDVRDVWEWGNKMILSYSAKEDPTSGNTSAWAQFFQSVVSLTRSLRVISLTVLADSIHNILICFAEKMSVSCKSYSHFFSAKNFSIFAYYLM